MPVFANVAVDLPADPKVAAAGDLAELVYIRSILHCRAFLTDGHIARAILPRITVGIRDDPMTHVKALVKVGLWETVDDGWRIPPDIWRKWNPTKDEVEAVRAGRHASGVLGNHRRWHVGKKVDPACPLCVPPIANGSHTRSVPDRRPDRKGDR